MVLPLPWRLLFIWSRRGTAVGGLAAITSRNTVTVPDHYPPLNIANFTLRIAGSTAFSKLNLQKGYYQVPVAPENIQKTAFIIPFGMYKFLRMPFGLKNDILIFSQDLSSHVENL